MAFSTPLAARSTRSPVERVAAAPRARGWEIADEPARTKDDVAVTVTFLVEAWTDAWAG